MDESELINKCLKGNEAAFTELYKRFSSRMYGVCIRYAKNRMDAQDLLHDGFIKVIETIKTYRNEGSFEGWLKRIMVNTSINFYNRSHTLRIYSIEDTMEVGSFNYDAISELSANELLDLINELPEGYRIIFNLYAIDGYKHTEIAEILNISENTSKTQLYKARIRLIEKVKQLRPEVYSKTIERIECNNINE